ncbi:MAG: PepSY-associated TM helix domain-containing protein [Beijerinckiaceae bacterium]
MALAVGFLFVLMGLSGTCNVFHQELDEWLNPELVIANPGGAYLPLDEIMQAVRAVHPARTGTWRIRMPARPHGMITASYMKPEEKAGEFWAPLMVSVNPYTAQVIKNRYWGETLMTFIFDIHAELLSR